MAKFALANADSLKYLSPSNADKCWRELVKAASRDHPFSTLAAPVPAGKITSARGTMYNSIYSFPKEVLKQRAESANMIPPAGT